MGLFRGDNSNNNGSGRGFSQGKAMELAGLLQRVRGGAVGGDGPASPEQLNAEIEALNRNFTNGISMSELGQGQRSGQSEFDVLQQEHGEEVEVDSSVAEVSKEFFESLQQSDFYTKIREALPNPQHSTEIADFIRGINIVLKDRLGLSISLIRANQIQKTYPAISEKYQTGKGNFICWEYLADINPNAKFLVTSSNGIIHFWCYNLKDKSWVLERDFVGESFKGQPPNEQPETKQRIYQQYQECIATALAPIIH